MTKPQSLTMSEVRERATLSIEEAGSLLGLGRAGSYAAAKNGTLPLLRFGKAKGWRVPVPALLRMLEEKD